MTVNSGALYLRERLAEHRTWAGQARRKEARDAHYQIAQSYLYMLRRLDGSGEPGSRAVARH